MSDDVKRQVRKCAFSVVEGARLKLQVKSGYLFAKELGYAGTTWNHWEKTGFAPFTAGLAAEALVRRQGQNYVAPDKVGVVVLLCNEQQLAQIEPVIKAFKITYQKVL